MASMALPLSRLCDSWSWHTILFNSILVEAKDHKELGSTADDL